MNAVIKEYISLIVEESDTRLKHEQMKIGCHLIMDPDAHVPDTLTRIRALATVTVVGQQAPVNRTSMGNTLLDIYIKFLPSSSSTYKNLISIAKLVKSLPGIRIVKVTAVGGRSVLYKGENIVV
jgi:hypothetical protein